MNKVMYQIAPVLSTRSQKVVLSYTTLKMLAATFETCLVILASVLGFSSYQFYTTGEIGAATNCLGIGATVGILFALISHSGRLYRMSALLEPVRNLKYSLLTLAMALFCLASFLFLLKVGGEYSRGSVITFAAFAFGLLPMGRWALARMCARGVQSGRVVGRRAVTLGEASELEKLAPHDLRGFGVEELARIGVRQSDATKGLGEAGRARVAGAIELSRDLRAAELVLVLPWSRDRLLAEIGDMLRVSPLPVKLIPDSKVRAVLRRQNNGTFDPALAVEIQREPLNRWERSSKRAIDVVLSLLAAISLAPLLLLTAAAIKLDSEGPVFFRQRRIGFDNKAFMIFKFRTMTVLDDGADVVQARRSDARVTRIGRLLRRSSVDELPQLFNVILGDMSLVGPRPHAVAHHDKYSAQIGTYAFRHHVKPGLTGMAQILGFRGETVQIAQMEKRVEHDLWYINHWSLWLDITIMARTCSALTRNDAY